MHMHVFAQARARGPARPVSVCMCAISKVKKTRSNSSKNKIIILTHIFSCNFEWTTRLTIIIIIDIQLKRWNGYGCITCQD